MSCSAAIFVARLISCAVQTRHQPESYPCAEATLFARSLTDWKTDFILRRSRSWRLSMEEIHRPSQSRPCRPIQEQTRRSIIPWHPRVDRRGRENKLSRSQSEVSESYGKNKLENVVELRPPSSEFARAWSDYITGVDTIQEIAFGLHEVHCFINTLLAIEASSSSGEMVRSCSSPTCRRSTTDSLRESLGQPEDPEIMTYVLLDSGYWLCPTAARTLLSARRHLEPIAYACV
jgi:hypothetical protein